MIVYLFMFAIALAIQLFCVFPRLTLGWIIVNLFLSAVCLLSFTLASCTSPGYLKSGQVEFMKLL